MQLKIIFKAIVFVPLILLFNLGVNCELKDDDDDAAASRFPIDVNDAVHQINLKLRYFRHSIQPNINELLTLNERMQTKKFNLHDSILLPSSSTTSNVSQACLNQVKTFFGALKNKDLWAITG
jgi:hypothetical protein